MTFILQGIVDFFYIVYLTVKGSNRTRVRPAINIHDEKLTEVTLKGFTLTIYCNELVYKTYYKNYLARNKQREVYRLYASCTNDAPQRLKDIVKSDVYLPDLTPRYISWDISRKQLISAYLDILITRLRELDE